MTLQELEQKVPELLDYTAGMPEEIRCRVIVKVHPPGSLIHQKDCQLLYFGIVAIGENRVINEFENGSIYLIETNKAIDFIGEVAILARKPDASVTIEAVTENVIAYIPRKDAERWIESDPHILRKMAERTAFKLYRSSYNNGLKLFYPPTYLLADFIVKFCEQTEEGRALLCGERTSLTISRTRTALEEELGINVKTLNRTIRTMCENRLFCLVKGKITVRMEHYQKIKEYLYTSRN